MARYASVSPSITNDRLMLMKMSCLWRSRQSLSFLSSLIRSIDGSRPTAVWWWQASVLETFKFGVSISVIAIDRCSSITRWSRRFNSFPRRISSSPPVKTTRSSLRECRQIPSHPNAGWSVHIFVATEQFRHWTRSIGDIGGEIWRLSMTKRNRKIDWRPALYLEEREAQVENGMENDQFISAGETNKEIRLVALKTIESLKGVRISFFHFRWIVRWFVVGGRGERDNHRRLEYLAGRKLENSWTWSDTESIGKRHVWWSSMLLHD